MARYDIHYRFSVEDDDSNGPSGPDYLLIDLTAAAKEVKNIPCLKDTDIGLYLKQDTSGEEAQKICNWLSKNVLFVRFAAPVGKDGPFPMLGNPASSPVGRDGPFPMRPNPSSKAKKGSDRKIARPSRFGLPRRPAWDMRPTWDTSPARNETPEAMPASARRGVGA